MSFVWSEYLDLAKELLASASGSSIEEAKLRSAISRAYYAVFHEARLFLIANRPTLIIPETGAAHDVVKDTFLDDLNPDWITVGVKLDRLKTNRRLADYKNPVTGLVNTATISMRFADEAIAKLKTL